MWLWDCQLRELGFTRKADRYWLCERCYGLKGHGHLSVFSWSEQTIPGARRRRFLVEVSEFHVTLARGGENIHFYYHEHLDNTWEPGGHTSCAEIRRLDLDPQVLRAQADAIAEAFVT